MPCVLWGQRVPRKHGANASWKNFWWRFAATQLDFWVAMKRGCSSATSPCTWWNVVSLLVRSVPERVSRSFQIPDLQFLCFGLVNPKKNTKKKQVHFVTWRVTCNKRFRRQILDVVVLFDVKRSLCTLMAPSFAWTRRWRNKVCSTSAW